MFYAKHRSRRKKMKFVKGIAMLLCLVTIFTSVWVGNLGIGAEDGASGDFKVKLNDNSVTSVVLPQDEKITLTVDENAGKQLRWQICADKSSALWVNISGQTKNFLTLSYAMVGSLLDRSGTTYVRCVADGKISTEVKVTLSYSVREPAVSANEPVRKAPVLKGVNPGNLTSYTIKVEYVYSDGTRAYEPYIANIEAGGSFTDTVKFPPVVGYLAYFENAGESSTEYKIDIPEVTENVIYKVTYKPTVVEFKVHHYKQNVLDDNYEYFTTTTAEGLTGDPVGENCDIEIDGFVPLWYDSKLKVAADGSTEIEIYYDRNYYLVLFNLDGGYGVDPIFARYEATVSVDKPTKPGYVFKEWELTECGYPVESMDTPTDGQKEDYNLENSVTLPNLNLKYKAKWETAETNYTVVYWAENADDDGYSYLSSKKVGAMSASTVSGADDYTWDEKQYFTYNSEKTDKNKIVEGDGSTVVNVYYKRNTYTLTFKALECDTWWHFLDNLHDDSCYKKIVATIEAKYGADIHENFPIKDGNNTIWWTVPSGCQSFVPGNYIGSIDTMPGENITFKKHASETGAKIYYYVETVNGEAGDTTYNGKNYKKYKVIDLEYSSSTNLTYAEEFHDIKGFEQGDSDPIIPVGGSVGMKRNNYLYYTRKTFNLKFYNYNAEVSGKGGSVQYEAPLNGYDFEPEYPKDMEPDAYEFAGWYTTPQCFAGSEVNFDTATMPDADVTLYAKWAPKKHNVRVFLTSDMKKQLGDTQSINHGSFAKAPTGFENGNYVFSGWFYIDNGEKKAFDFNNMPVNKDLDIFAEWSSKTPVLYTVRYVDKNGNEVADPTIGSALAGTSKTFIAKGGDELYKNYQNGYFPNTNSHTIRMDINGGNEFTFVYTELDSVPYKVRYLEKGTNKVLHPEKYVADNKKSVVTEKFEQVERYMPDAYQKRLILSANEAENVLNFWYTEDNEHAYYLIRYWQQNLEGDGYTEFRTIQGPGTIGATITADPLTLTGFNYNSGKSTASGTLTAEGLVLDLYYDRIEYTYTVRYLEHGTEKVLHNEKTSDVKYRYGKVVTENAIDIPGYTLVGEATKALTIRDKDKDKDNVITFYYSEKQVSVKYVPVPADKGVLSIGSETVGAKTGTPNGSTPTANSGYRFVGWFTDEACTNPVPAEWVGADNKLVPQKNADGLYEAATYYAKFESSLADLTIKKSGCNEEIDENQSFIFRIKGNDENTNGIDLKVVIKGNGKITIADLPVGNYTVTEETSWSWRYTPDEASKNVDLEPEGDSVEFKNTRSDDKWLSGDAHKPNKYN